MSPVFLVADERNQLGILWSLEGDKWTGYLHLTTATASARPTSRTLVPMPFVSTEQALRQGVVRGAYGCCSATTTCSARSRQRRSSCTRISFGIKGGVIQEREFAVFHEWLVANGQLKAGVTEPKDAYTNQFNPYR